MVINSEIFKGIRNVGKRKNAKIQLFTYPTELYEVLDNLGLIEKLKNTSLLGSITVKKKDSYSRFDYIMMQLYIYQVVNEKLNSELSYSLGNRYKYIEFKNKVLEIRDSDFEKYPTVGDALQIMAFIYNIGHFKKTFTASRAMIYVLKSNEKFRNDFINNFKYDIHKEIAKKIIDLNEYHRFHLLNSLILLLNMDVENSTVRFSINILTEYLLDDEKQSEKTRYVFNLFKSIREVCFVWIFQ